LGAGDVPGGGRTSCRIGDMLLVMTSFAAPAGAGVSSMRDLAFWPRTFLDEIERAEVGATPVLWALGGPSFLYRSAETTIWIDPYFGGTPDDAVADAYRATAIPVNPDE